MRSRPPHRRRGLTLVELAVTVAVMSLVTVVLGGLTAAVGTARTHVEGLREATTQSQFVTERIAAAVARAGVYRLPGQSSVPGALVVTNRYGSVNLPDTLVVWTGGIDGPLAEATVLPRGNQLVAFTPDPTDPTRLVEVTVPLIDEVDFTDPGFPQQVRDGIRSVYAKKVVLCDRLRVGQATSTASAPAVRFALETSDAAGLRTLRVRTELQVQASDRPSAPALPIFGSAVRRYVHLPAGG